MALGWNVLRAFLKNTILIIFMTFKKEFYLACSSIYTYSIPLAIQIAYFSVVLH